MTGVLDLLALGVRNPREAAVLVPETVLDVLLRESQAPGGCLGLGNDVLVSRGGAGAASQRFELPGGRDTFWVEIFDGIELAEPLRLASGVVLSAWAVRDELKKARFAERRRLWEAQSLRAIGEALGGTLESTHIAEELLMHAAALLDARRGEVWLAGSGLPATVTRLLGAEAATPCPTGSCIMAARVGGPVLTEDEIAALNDEGLGVAGWVCSRLRSEKCEAARHRSPTPTSRPWGYSRPRLPWRWRTRRCTRSRWSASGSNGSSSWPPSSSVSCCPLRFQACQASRWRRAASRRGVSGATSTISPPPREGFS
jgi:hypothetical protein